MTLFEAWEKAYEDDAIRFSSFEFDILIKKQQNGTPNVQCIKCCENLDYISANCLATIGKVIASDKWKLIRKYPNLTIAEIGWLRQVLKHIDKPKYVWKSQSKDGTLFAIFDDDYSLELCRDLGEYQFGGIRPNVYYSLEDLGLGDLEK